jgi:hypothetical protein
MKISKKAFLGIVLIGLSFNILAQVGIGTSNPHVSAALEIQSTSKGFLFPRMTEVARDAISNIATGLTIYCTDCGTSGEGVLQVYNASNWEDLNDFVSASTGGMFTEKVGIGTIGTTPIYALDVDANNKGSSTYSARFTNSAEPEDKNLYNIVLFTQGESDTAIGYLGTGGSGVLNAAFKKSFVVGTKNNSPLVLNTNDTEQMRIDSLGNVGIGTSSPSARLHLLTSSNVYTATDMLKLSSVDFDPNHYVGFQLQRNNSMGQGLNLMVTSNAGVVNEALRVTDEGNLLVGTTNAYGKLSVDAPLEVASFRNSGGTGNIRFQNTTGETIGYIQWSGSITSYVSPSDQRLKENIADADDAGSKIDAIQVRKYDWKVDGSHQDYGMIAQELQAVAPVAVSGDADSEEMMGVDYSKLVPMLIKEIQSLRSRVAQLEN